MCSLKAHQVDRKMHGMRIKEHNWEDTGLSGKHYAERINTKNKPRSKRQFWKEIKLQLKRFVTYLLVRSLNTKNITAQNIQRTD